MAPRSARAALILAFAMVGWPALAAGGPDVADAQRYSVTLRHDVTLADVAATDPIACGSLPDAGVADGLEFVVPLSAQCAEALKTNPAVLRVEPVAPSASVVPDAGLQTVRPDWAAGVAYDYDGAGNITTMGADSFTYDSVGRLVQAIINGEKRVYGYDPFGNRISCTADNNVKCQSQSVDPLTNRVTGVDYDPAGNVEALHGRRFTYDATGAVIRVESDSAATREFIYNADGERIAVNTTGDVWRWTLRDGANLVVREFTSRDSSAGVPGAADLQWVRDNVWLGRALLASRQATATGVTTYHYHADHLGTPRMITNGAGEIIATHDYRAFGEEIGGNKGEPTTSPYKFTGHERELDGLSESLDYMHARYYDATLGRFLSVDPVLGDPAVPQSWNRYSYALNNPSNFTDPTGMKPCTMTLPDGTEAEGECIDVEADADDVDEIDWAQGTSDFFAGFGDSLTFGGTKVIREAISRTLFDTNTPVNPCSAAYAFGEYTEIGLELAATGGAMGLRVAASQASRRAVRSAARSATRGMSREAGQAIHHSNPLFGHPGGAPALFPTGGLPAAIHSGSWNLQALSHAEHMAAHRYMRGLENAGRLAVNPATTAARVARNGTGQQQCGG